MKKIIKATKHITDSFLTITLSDEGCGGGRYFSVTGETKYSSGCLHEEILKSRPDLQPLVDLHLSNLDGVPMHALENGYWWLAKAAHRELPNQPDQSPETCLEYFCNHCRISKIEAAAIILKVQESEHPKAEWAKIMEEMKPRWKKEAQYGLALMSIIH